MYIKAFLLQLLTSASFFLLLDQKSCLLMVYLFVKVRQLKNLENKKDRQVQKASEKLEECFK